MLTSHRPPHDDPDMLTISQRRAVGAWYDGVAKIVALVGGILTILLVGWAIYSFSVGGIRIGSQVETETLAATTKATNDALTAKIGGVEQKMTGIEDTLDKIRNKLEQVPLSAQKIVDMDVHLGQIDQQLKAVNDRINIVSENLNGRMMTDENAASELRGRLGAPGIRQPR